MDEDNSKNQTGEENEPPRLTPDPTDGIHQAKEEDRPRHRNDSQPKHHVWGMSRYEFLTVIVGLIGIASGVIGTIVVQRLQSHTTQLELSRAQQRERARIVLYGVEMASTKPLAFSLTFRNVGETSALDTSGAWLHGECKRTPEQCALWCLKPLSEQRGKSYGPIAPQGEHTERFSYAAKPEKTGKGKSVRQERLPIYFCGYIAYTDVFCVRRKPFQCLYYDPAIEDLRFCPVSYVEQKEDLEYCQ